MQWKYYHYELIEDGVIITKYLAETESVDLLAGSEKSLLFDLQTDPDSAKTGPTNLTVEKHEQNPADTRMEQVQEGEEAEQDEASLLDLCIPSHIDGQPVVEIGEEAFSEYGALLTRVEVPETVKRIGNAAFKMCMSLTGLVLHEGLETIGEEAFYLTPLTELWLPSTVSQIGRAWELGNIQWQIDAKNPHFFSDGYGLYHRYSAPKTDTGCRQDNQKDNQKGYQQRQKDNTPDLLAQETELLVVAQMDDRPDYTVAFGTTIIGENAFAGNGTLVKVSMPSTVHTICEAAFESCQNLAEVELSEGLREIGPEAFSHCICLKEIHLPSTLENLGRNALSDTYGWSDTLVGLEHITVNDANPCFETDEDALYEIASFEPSQRYLVKYFGQDRTYRVPDNVSRILPGAFRRAKFHKISIPQSVRDVAQDAFRECKDLEAISLEDSGTILYVPGQPVYRKEEITALFHSSERDKRKEQSDRDNPSQPADLPEKWKAFARTAIYTKTEDVSYDPYETYVYDYKGYDGLFHTYLNLPDQYGMACCRLKYPVLLSLDVKQKYETFIRENLPEILQSLAERQDMYHLAALAELGFFQSENIEECMEVFNRSGRTKMVSYLLNYQRDKLGETEFDFEL